MPASSNEPHPPRPSTTQTFFGLFVLFALYIAGLAVTQAFALQIPAAILGLLALLAGLGLRRGRMPSVRAAAEWLLPLIPLFLIPVCILMVGLSWPFFMQSYEVGEWSNNSGGLLRWPIKFVIPAGFTLLALQAVSEIIKRIAALNGWVVIDAKYERPVQ